jgi:hypothetical protein
MGQVISLTEYRKKKNKIPEITDYDKYIELVRSLLGEWTDHKRFNRLNKFVGDEINEPSDNYITDLNLLNQIELGIGIRTMIFHPSSTDKEDTGFISGFRYKDQSYPTPALPTEAEARAFNVVLYMRMMTNV